MRPLIQDKNTNSEAPWGIHKHNCNSSRTVWENAEKTNETLLELNLPLGGSDLGGYEHSRRTGATVQIVDKIEIANGNLTAERHLRVSQPYQAQNPLPLTCMFPAGPSARRK
jgi:hypothetical protein